MAGKELHLLVAGMIIYWIGMLAQFVKFEAILGKNHRARGAPVRLSSSSRNLDDK